MYTPSYLDSGSECTRGITDIYMREREREREREGQRIKVYSFLFSVLGVGGGGGGWDLKGFWIYFIVIPFPTKIFFLFRLEERKRLLFANVGS